MEIVLNSYGAKLSINNGAFMLNNSTGSHRIPVKDVDSILVAKSAVLTSDALILAIENDIRVTLADKGGNVMGCVWSHKYGSISTIRKGQLIFTASQDAVEWIKKVIIQKMQNQLAMLLMLQVDTGKKELIVQEAGNKISKLIAKVDALEGFTVREIANNLRAYEGNASKEYFRALNRFIQRTLPTSGYKCCQRHAQLRIRHPVWKDRECTHTLWHRSLYWHSAPR